MGFFSIKKNNVRYGVIVDIGSGSVLASIVASDSTKTHPDIIWSKREYTPQRQSKSIADSAKSVMTSLFNVLMLLDSEGRKVFYEKTGEQKLPLIQVTIAAPWSYTVTKTISYSNNKEFEVSSELIEELLRTAQQKVQEELLENEKVNKLGLSIIVRTTMQIAANGYPIAVNNNQDALTVVVIQASAVAQKYLTDAIADTKDKLFPDAQISQYSFMLPYYYVMNNIGNTTLEYCLVDITYEATEIGVVREGVLNYCTHVPKGSFTIAREIAQILSITPEEAYGYLEESDFSSFLSQYTDAQKQAVSMVIDQYQDDLARLFKETGDSLAIPKKIYIHGNLKTEPFFNKQIISAAGKATKMKHATYNVTSELIVNNYSQEELELIKQTKVDTALLISAQFFHMNDYHSKFEHL